MPGRRATPRAWSLLGLLLLVLSARQIYVFVAQEKALIARVDATSPELLLGPGLLDPAPKGGDDEAGVIEGGSGSNRSVNVLGGGTSTTAGRPHRETSALPRTSNRPYNRLDLTANERYLLYSPSGGFNNQLVCLVSALFIARQANRTLIVPPKGKHANLYYGYYRLEQSQTIPMDHVLDFPYLESETGVKLIPLNTTLKEFHASSLDMAEQNTSLLELHLIQKNFVSAPRWYQEQIVAGVVASASPVVWVRGHFYSPFLGGLSNQHGVHRHDLRYSPYLRHLSAGIVSELFPSGNFNAMHIRLGDYFKRARRMGGSDASGFVVKGRNSGMERDVPLYVATDGNSSGSYFEPIVKYWRNVTYSGDLERHPQIGSLLVDLNARLPASFIRGDLFGLVEQLICVQARMFLGTRVSSFSKSIINFRKKLKASMPDIMDRTDPPFNTSGRWDETIPWGAE